MENQKIVIEKDLLFGQLQKTIDLLGDQIKVVPVYVNNHSAHDVTKTEVTPQALRLLIENQSKYGGYKIHANSPSPLDTHFFLVVDYDDHTDEDKSISVKERRIALHSKFNLPPTFSVKTPSGEGIHEYYLVPKEVAVEIGKWSQLVGIPQIPATEIKIGLPHLKTGFPGPGTHREGSYYTIIEERAPAEVSQEFMHFLLAKRLKEKESFSTPAGTETTIDSSVNVANAQSYISEAVLPYILKQKPPCFGAQDSRNNKLYSLAMECFRRNLSKEMTIALLEPVNANPRIFSSSLSEDEVEATIASAFDNTQQNKLHHTKAIDPDLEPYKKDEYGQKIISYESYKKKTELLSKYTKSTILSDSRLFLTFCELVILHKGLYYVPSIQSQKKVIDECERQLKDSAEFGTAISVDAVTKLLSETSLHWQAFKPAEFKDRYQFVDRSNNDRIKPVTSSPVFISHHIDLSENNLIQTAVSTFPYKNILESENFYMVNQAPITPIPKGELYSQPTDTEIEFVKEMLDRHIRRIVDPNNFEQERDFLLGRYALLLQRPNTRTENILILRGEQGTGKSAFFNLFRPFFHSSQTKNFDSSSRLENNFTNLAYISHFDDSTIDFDERVIDKLKNISTSSTQYEERKGIDAVEVIKPINISLTTNREIENTEVLLGRRWTVLNNSEMPDREAIRKDVFNTFTKLLENNLRLYYVFATYMHQFDATKFKPNFKSVYQRNVGAERAKGENFIKRILGVVVNYGYYSPEIRVFEAGKSTARLDVYDHLLKYKDVKRDTNKQVRAGTIFKDISNADAKARTISYWKRIAPLSDMNQQAKISHKYGFTLKSPDLKDLITLIAVFMYDSADITAVDSVIAKYGLMDHWNWSEGEEMKIPTGTTLGDIDPFAYMDPDEIEDEDDEF